MKIALIIIICFVNNAFSQIIDSPETILKIKGGAEKYLTDKNELNNGEKFFIKEIIDKAEIGYKSKGIYRLYLNRSPSFTYIILKEGEKFQVLDLWALTDSLKTISEFLSSGFDNEAVVRYMEEILKIYRYNRYDEKIRF
ncbi:hypothetical protein AM493_17165 [Flavobacterium akiainvivens]|uniref:Uncharacterized protein n=1 Tax=Flavobacterium akiainvivens TaxID=1202724 RepID=A0A0M8MKT2_9FLAO|nr:hypothetical protein [Flavobacterium akiainvivens]KOS07578.1 hypothetical protein AM493_17165 [Flavobacterium akiainvivens]SFQ22028.1 hypothetical protein SAMN05444144_10213 [Flavobacterium akiainvivens]